MAIVQQASGQATGSTSYTVSLPAASSAANLVVLFIVSDNVQPTTVSGWTFRKSQVDNVGHYLFDRAGGATSYTLTATSAADQIVWAVLEIQAGVFDKAASADNPANATSYASPSITPTSGPKTLLASFGAQHYFANVPGTFAYSNSFTSDSMQVFAATANTAQGVAHQNVTATGSTAYTTTATNSPSQVASWSSIIASYVTSSGTAGTVALPVATGTGSASIPTVSGTVSVSGGGPATGTGSAPAPVVSGGAAVTVPVAAGSGVAPAPTASAAVAGNVTIPAAQGTGSAPAPTAAGAGTGAAAVGIPPANGSGAAPAPSAGGGGTVQMVPAVGSALALVVVASGGARVIVPAAMGRGTAPAPSVPLPAGEDITVTVVGPARNPVAVVSAGGSVVTVGPPSRNPLRVSGATR